MNTKELIRAEIIRLQESTLDENRNFQSERAEGAFDVLSKLERFVDTLSEEPVNENLEKEYPKFLEREWFSKLDKGRTLSKQMFFTAQYFANWQKERTINKACEWLKEQEEMIGISFQEDFIERFRKAMEEEND